MDDLTDNKTTDLAKELQKSENLRARLIEKNRFLYRENKRLKSGFRRIFEEKSNLKKELNNVTQTKQGLEGKIKSILGKLKRFQNVEYESKKIREELTKYKDKLQELNALRVEKKQLLSKYEEIKKQKKFMIEVVLTERYEWINRLRGMIRNIPVDYLDMEKKLKLVGKTRHKVGKHARVALFVDVQNMFYSAKNLYNGRLDYEKFLESTVGGRSLVQATAYIVQTPDIDQTKFISLLKSMGYIVRTMDLKTGTGGFAKGNWDVGMAIDILSMIDKIDILILASGDGDFVPIVKLYQKKGVGVEVFSFAYNTAIDLKEIADKFYPITADLLIQDFSNNSSK